MSCKLTQSKVNSCTKKQKQGGVETTMWLYNIEEGGEEVSYTEATVGVVTDIILPTGAVLHRVDTEKFASSFGHSFEKPALNSFFPQTVNIVSILDSVEDLAWYTEILRADKVGVVVLDNNRQFKILGQYAGLNGSSGDGYNSGNEQGADVSTMVLLDGAETSHPYKFLDLGDYATTKAYLVALETI
jgi:hypothetical protein